MLSAVAGPKAPGPKYGQPVAPNLNVRTLCPNCRSDPPNIVEEYSKGDLVCGDCGTILGDRIVDTRSEWRTFAGDEGGDDPSRVGDAGDPLLGDLLQTHINQGGGRNGEAQKLARAASRIASTTNGATSMAALQAAFGRITEKCETMQLPSKVTNIAKHIYKIADESRLIRGKNEMALVAACIVLASRSAKVDRSLVEVAKATHVPKKELGRVLNLTKDIIRKSKTGLNTSNNASDSTLANSEQSTDASLARFVNFLDLGHGVHNAAKYIANAASAKTEIDGRSPLSIAAGVLYFTCVLFGKEVTARNIAELAKISESTTKLVCKLIAQKLDDVIRPEWKAQHDKGYNDLASLGKISKRAKSESPLAALPSPKVEDGAQ